MIDLKLVLAERSDGALYRLPPTAGALPQAIELQENGDFVLCFLAEDVGKDLDCTLDAILRALGPAVVI